MTTGRDGDEATVLLIIVTVLRCKAAASHRASGTGVIGTGGACGA